MSKYINSLLAKDEVIVRIARDHWITLLLTIVVDVALVVVIIGLSLAGILLSPPWTWFGLLFLLVPIGHFVVRMITWWNNRYVITDRRLMQVKGTTRKRVSDTELEKINDVIMEQSAWGQMLNFGDIEVLTGSEVGLDWFRRIADPIGFKKDLYAQKDTLGGRVLAADSVREPSGSDARHVPDMIAELDQLRTQGLITDDEFESKKRQLLDRI